MGRVKSQAKVETQECKKDYSVLMREIKLSIEKSAGMKPSEIEFQKMLAFVARETEGDGSLIDLPSASTLSQFDNTIKQQGALTGHACSQSIR